jgi:hypothetical protein
MQLESVLELVLDPLTDEPVICESAFDAEILRLPPHPAQWYAISACPAAVIAVCDGRKAVAERDNGWRCVPGCGRTHAYGEIRWDPIRSLT